MAQSIVKSVKAPLYQQVVDWLREKHDIVITVESTFAVTEPKYMTKYSFTIDGQNIRGSSSSDTYLYARPENHFFNKDHSKHIRLEKFTGTYYEALNKAIEEALKLI